MCLRLYAHEEHSDCTLPSENQTGQGVLMLVFKYVLGIVKLSICPDHITDEGHVDNVACFIRNGILFQTFQH